MSSKFIPPTTGKKKKALRVFGTAVADDIDNSLSYSPSPQKTSNECTGLAVSKAAGLFPLNENNSSDGDDISRCQSSGTFDSVTTTEKENNASSIGNNAPSSITTVVAATSMKDRVRNMRLQSRSPLRRDLVKKTQDAINKASASVNQSLHAAREAKKASHLQKKQQASKIRRNWKENTNEAKVFTKQAEQNRREILSLKRDLASKYNKEKASRELMERQAFLNKAEQEVQFNSEVYREHQKKKKDEKNERRRQSVEDRSKIRLNHRMGLQKLKLEQIQEEQAIIEERHEASIALRSAIQQNAKQRRNSFAFRNGDALRIRQLHTSMEAERMRSEHRSFELKWQGEKDAEEYHRKLAQERRDSLAMRNATCRKQRQLESEEHSKVLASEHDSYELQRAAEKDAEAYKRSLDDERRKSLAQRNQYARQQREQSRQTLSKQLATEHDSFELKWAGENDADEYLRKVEQERRNSLAFRNKEGKRQRDLVKQQFSDVVLKKHDSFELKWAGEKDAECHMRQMEEERRNSLAYRNLDARRKRLQTQQEESDDLAREHESFELKRAADKDADAYKREQDKLRRESLARRNSERVQHAKVMEELRMIAREKETESYVLKWAGENDAKAYLAKVEQEKRQSLQVRGKQTLHHRQVESEQQQEILNQLHKDDEMKSADQKDIEAYRRECAERDRKSFEYRRKEARIQRIQEEERLLKQRELDDKNFELETLARVDVKEYVKDCKRRKRLSLAFRAKEKRHHAEWQSEQNETDQDEQSRRVHDRLMDQRHVELAQQKERARYALEAIRHAGCSFNPFSVFYT